MALSRRLDSAGKFDPQGMDDGTTLRSIRQVTLTLAQSLSVAGRVVEALEYLPADAQDGALTPGERRLVARIVDEVERDLT